MIASKIGQVFLDAYNEKFNTTYSAKDFFVENYFSLFFDHPKYMQWVINSPFVQGIKKGVTPTVEERKLKLEKFIGKISENEADASIAIGFPSLDITATTSGQLTNIHLPLKEEDAYLSWIGSGFGIGVQSGLSLLFDNKQLLLDLYEGWQLYREYLNDTPKLRGNQINTWNGQWIAHRYNSHNYDEQYPTASFTPLDTMKNGGQEIGTIAWTEVMIGIARNYHDSQMTAYIYSLGKTNITIGFIPFQLPKIRYPYELYEKYFGTADNVKALFGSPIGFIKACQMGAIGINALEPEGFRDCVDKGVVPKYSDTDKEKLINFNTYQIWLLAMLNKEEQWDKSQQIAQLLVEYENGAEKARTDRRTNVKELLAAKTSILFQKEIESIIKDCMPDSSSWISISKIIHFMEGDEYRYFSTLVRLKYAAILKK